MMRSIWVSGLILLASVPAVAQKNAIQRGAEVHFRQGTELFDKGKYNAAMAEFREYLADGTDKMWLSDARYYIAVGKLKLEHLDGVAAVEEFIMLNPDSRKLNDANFALGDYYFYQAKYSRAMSHYNKVDISAVPDYDVDRFIFSKGYSQFMTKKYSDARETLEPLTLRSNKYELRATYYFGYAAYYNGNYDDALLAFKKVEDKGPQSLKLYIAQIYYLKSDYKKAIDYCDKVKLASLQNKLNLIKAKCHYRLYEFPQAAEAFDKSGIGPDSVNNNEKYEAGYTYYKTGNLDKAYNYLSPIANNGDSLAQVASFNLADIFLKTNRKQNAYNAFFEAQRNDFNKTVREKSLYNYAKLGAELGFDKTAINSFQKFLEDFPTSPDADNARSYLAQMFLVTSDYKTAIPILESISNWDDKTKEVYQKVTYYRGQELLQSRDFDNARAMFDKSLKYKYDKQITAETWFGQAEIDYHNAAYGDASRNYQKFLDEQASRKLSYYPIAFYNIGYCYFKQKKYKDATPYFQEYKRTAATTTFYTDAVFNDGMTRLGDCNYATKSFNSALDAYSYVITKNADGSDYALFQKGMIQGIQKQSQNKINTLKRIATEYPNSPMVPDALFEVANEHNKIGNYKEAERNYLYIIDDYKGSVLVKRCYYSLGLLYNAQDFTEKALNTFKTIVAQFPGTEESAASMKWIEKIYVGRGQARDYLEWVKTIPSGAVTATKKDSLLYTSAYNRYLNKDYTGAITEFEYYLTEFKSGFFAVPANFFKARCHENNNQNETAVYHYKKVVDAPANDYQEEALTSLCKIQYIAGQYADALPNFEKLETMARTRQKLYEAVIGQVRCNYKLGFKDKAKTKANQFLAYDKIYPSQQAECQNILGKYALEEKNFSTALNWFQKTYNAHEDVYGAEAKYHEALTYYNMDSLNYSRKSIFQFNDQFSSFDFWLGKSFILLGDIYYRKGDEFQARATWNSVIENFEDPEVILEAKSRLDQLKKPEAPPEEGN